MPQGLWRADPPPQPRQPSAPIPAQGQPPPRVATQVATAMAIVAMAWWPASGEPRSVQPRQVRLPSAPIPAQGQQPPAVGALQLATVRVIVGQWPPPSAMPPAIPPIAPLTTVVPVVVQPYPSPQTMQLLPVGSWLLPGSVTAPAPRMAPLVGLPGVQIIRTVPPLAVWFGWVIPLNAVQPRGVVASLIPPPVVSATVPIGTMTPQQVAVVLGASREWWPVRVAVGMAARADSGVTPVTVTTVVVGTVTPVTLTAGVILSPALLNEARAVNTALLVRTLSLAVPVTIGNPVLSVRPLTLPILTTVVDPD